MSGLLEILVGHGGHEDLPKLAHELTFEVDDLLPLSVDAAQLLGLAEVDDAGPSTSWTTVASSWPPTSSNPNGSSPGARERAPLVPCYL